MAPNSSDTTAGADGSATQYNNLRADVLNISTGHTHSGSANEGKLVTGLATTVAFGSAVTRYLAISPGNFVPEQDTSDWSINSSRVQPGSNTAQLLCYAGIQLPNGAIVTSLKVNWTQAGHANQGSCSLYRYTPATNTNDAMATADSGATTTGIFTVEDTSISYATIDNTQYSYCIVLSLDAVDDATEINFNGLIITYTILAPLP